jgi:hypothetical protein
MDEPFARESHERAAPTFLNGVGRLTEPLISALALAL